MKKAIVYIVILLFAEFAFAQIDPQPASQNVTYWLSGDELLRKSEIGKNFRLTNPPIGPIHTISEFQPMQGVIIKYPLGVPISLVQALADIVPVTIITENSQLQNNANYYFSNNNVNMSNINFIIASTDTYWTRDFGPIFITDGNDEIGIVDFIYNRPRPNDDQFAEVIANHLNTNYFSMNMIHTGGNFMADGYGRAASTTLLLNENPTQSQNDILATAENYLGIDEYYFLPDPMDDYIEHIDCWGKFLDVDKIMIGQVQQSDPRYNNYETLAQWFENHTTPWGNHYSVYRVYTPGNNAIVPYTNSLIINDHVFVPQSGSSWDDDAIESYQNAMPGYTIVPILFNEWENTDALHCRTHEIADLQMLMIRHYPLLGTQHYQEHYTVSADITAFSGANLITDSLLVIYSTDSLNWNAIQMQPAGEKTYTAEFPTFPENSRILYYIYAKDQAQKTETHPYIGKSDPHCFITGMINGVNSLTQKQNISITPNPASENFTLSGAPIDRIDVFNLMGQNIISYKTPISNTYTVDCTQWISGIYILKIHTLAGTTESAKIIVK